MANFFDFLDPRNAPGVNLFMGKATDPLAQQAKENNQKGQILDKTTLKGDARLMQGSMPGGAWLNEKLDNSQRQPSYDQLQQDPTSYPQFSSLIKQQPVNQPIGQQIVGQQPASQPHVAMPSQTPQPIALGQNPSTTPLQAMLQHPIMQQWLGSLPNGN